MKVGKWNATKHKVYKDKNIYFPSKGIHGSKVLQPRGFTSKLEVMRLRLSWRRKAEFVAFEGWKRFKHT